MEKKIEEKIKKDVAELQQNERREIPFVKPARVGNFKVWRSRKSIGKGKDKVDIEQINVSTLDESWQIKIPATFSMFALISELYESNELNGPKKNDGGRLASIFGNMLYASCVANGYFQQAIQMCAAIYANPTVLNEEDEAHSSFMKDVKALIAGFLDWRKDYEKKIASESSTDDDMKNDEVAEEMIEVVDAKQPAEQAGRSSSKEEENGNREKG